MTIFRSATALLILCLFSVGSIPAVGEAFTGKMHWVIHLSTFALIAFNFGLGWQNMRAMHVAIIVTTIGVIHELTEIITHSHGFELRDAIVDGFGALIGVSILNMLQKLRQEEP